ncbi:hypothetical protein [Nocardia terpenica]|uniref:hypothetical protein n=1 Tax=Nocardia terpenica TaxID=455432 RepID=UPI0012FD8FC8|nr:hypothetical protein [Nocardia terpenica]
MSTKRNNNNSRTNATRKNKWDENYLANKQKHRESKREIADRMAELIKKIGEDKSPENP